MGAAHLVTRYARQVMSGSSEFEESSDSEKTEVMPVWTPVQTVEGARNAQPQCSDIPPAYMSTSAASQRCLSDGDLPKTLKASIIHRLHDAVVSFALRAVASTRCDQSEKQPLGSEQSMHARFLGDFEAPFDVGPLQW